MTRTEAERLVSRIRAGEIHLQNSPHAREALARRRFSPSDFRAILSSHRMEFAPAWDEKHRNFKVSLVGKRLEGRPTRAVIGLRTEGPCVLITIMVIRNDGRRNK